MSRVNAARSPWRSGRARQRDRDLKRDAVVRTAARAFNEHGYHNTSLDDVAAALGVTKPTVYYYVENKEQLLFECFCAGLEPIRQAVREALVAAGPARTRLLRVVREYAAAIASDYGWCMVRAADQDLGAETSAHVRALKSEIDQGIRQLIRDGIADGSIQPCDPKVASFAIAGALNGIAHWFRDDQPMSAAQVAEAFASLFDGALAPRVRADS